MKFVEVKELPKNNKRTYRGELRDRLDEFMKMNLKVAKLEDHGYKSNSIAYRSFHKGVQRWVFPIDVVMRNGEVYLVRRDL